MSRRGHMPRGLPGHRGLVDGEEGVNFVNSKVVI
jgi:hypothetical protein